MCGKIWRVAEQKERIVEKFLRRWSEKGMIVGGHQMKG
jgi:hypothetical protein